MRAVGPKKNVLAVLCMTALAGTAHAQSRPSPRPSRPPGDRIRISINAADQVTSRTLKQSFNSTINAEPAPISTSIDLRSAPLFDIGGSYRFLNRLAAGVSVSTLSRGADGTLDARVPHPFFFNMPRSVSGELPGLPHKETGVHIYAMYVMPVSRKLVVGLFGGPSHFSVRQGFATDVNYTSSYPFDTARFTGAPTATISSSVTGFNVGTDVSWRLTRTFAVGGLLRFTGGSTTVNVASGNDVDVKVGGVQTGAGLRILF